MNLELIIEDLNRSINDVKNLNLDTIVKENLNTVVNMVKRGMLDSGNKEVENKITEVAKRIEMRDRDILRLA